MNYLVAISIKKTRQNHTLTAPKLFKYTRTLQLRIRFFLNLLILLFMFFFFTLNYTSTQRTLMAPTLIVCPTCTPTLAHSLISADSPMRTEQLWTTQRVYHAPINLYIYVYWVSLESWIFLILAWNNKCKMYWLHSTRKQPKLCCVEWDIEHRKRRKIGYICISMYTIRLFPSFYSLQMCPMHAVYRYTIHVCYPIQAFSDSTLFCRNSN